MISFFVTRNNLKGNFLCKTSKFTINGKFGREINENGKQCLIFSLKNGILNSWRDNQSVFWDFKPHHSYNFREHLEISPVIKTMEINISDAALPEPVRHIDIADNKWIIDPCLYCDFEDGLNSFEIDNHGRDFTIQFGEAVFGFKDNEIVNNNANFQIKDCSFSNFSLERYESKFIVSWIKAAISQKENQTQKYKFNVDLHGQDGQIKIGDLFIVVSNGEYNANDKNCEIKNIDGIWQIVCDNAQNNALVMVSSPDGTIKGNIQNGILNIERSEKPDILSGNFETAYNTEIKFLLNNKPAKINEKKEIYFVIAEGMLLLSNEGKERTYIFHPNDKYQNKSFARKINLVATYPDGSSEIIDNVIIQKTILPTIAKENVQC